MTVNGDCLKGCPMFHDPDWFDDACSLDPRHGWWAAPDAGDDPPRPRPHPVGHLLRTLWARLLRPVVPPGVALRCRSASRGQQQFLQFVAEAADREHAPLLQPCRACQATGMCAGCRGNGRVLVDQGRRLAACDRCVGDGACPACRGTGTQP